MASISCSVVVGAVFASRLLAVLEDGFTKPVPLRPRGDHLGDKSPGQRTSNLIAAFMRLSHDISPPSSLVLLRFAGVMTLGMVAGKPQIDAGNDVKRARIPCAGPSDLVDPPLGLAVLAMLVLVQGRRRVAAVLGAVFLFGLMWFTPRGQFLNPKDGWWQADAFVWYLGIGGVLVFFVASRPSSGTRSTS